MTKERREQLRRMIAIAAPLSWVDLHDLDTELDRLAAAQSTHAKWTREAVDGIRALAPGLNEVQDLRRENARLASRIADLEREKAGLREALEAVVAVGCPFRGVCDPNGGASCTVCLARKALEAL
jgi:chromosome segregation ATPase